MTSFLTKQKQEEKNKRYLFIGVGGAGVLTTFFLTPLIGIPMIVAGAYLGWRWFQYRVKNGMRF